MPAKKSPLLKQSIENDVAYRIAMIAATKGCTIDRAAKMLMDAAVLARTLDV